MHNIEIHGYNASDTALMTGILATCLTPFADDIVISEYAGVVMDPVTRKDSPYLRIVCVDAAEAQRIVDLLGPIKIDIEVLLLHAFIPKQK
jgi:hypothetical protein